MKATTHKALVATADLYNDATAQILGSDSPPQAQFFIMQQGCVSSFTLEYNI